MAAYLRHERFYLLVDDVGLLYLVDGTEELLGAYLLRRRQFAHDELLADDALHLAHLVLLA